MSTRGAGFRPPWWATLGTLSLGALFITAGVWQLNRAAEKSALFAAFAGGAVADAIPAPAPGADTAALRYRHVTASGRFDPAHQILLDARTRDGRAGYEVLAPLVGESFTVLVNRGWVPADPDRTRLPDVAVGGSARTVAGLLDRLPRAALGHGQAEAAGWPRRMLFPTATEIGAALGYPVADYQVLLGSAEPDGLRRDWRPAEMSPQQHVGYAVQWFALTIAIVVIYVVLNRRNSTPKPDSP